MRWVGVLFLWAQDADLWLGHEAYHWVDRMEIQGRISFAVASEVKPYPREELETYLSALDTIGLGSKDRRWQRQMAFFLSDTLPYRRKALFFPNRRDLFVVHSRWGSLYINPLIRVGMGRDSINLYQNGRGVSLRFRSKKLGAYADFLEIQERVAPFIQKRYDTYGVLYGEGFLKVSPKRVFDYLNFRGYLTFSPIKALRIKFGRDKVFWGSGFQSLWLGDYPTEYLYLHLRTRIGKVEYHNLFTQWIDFIPNKPDAIGTYPRKYAAFHQLLWRPKRAFTVGLMEGIVYTPYLPYGYRGFELQYLNPIIFYRAIEQYLGSPDNSFLGALAKANFLRRFQLYAQLNIDDYNFGMRKQGKGWWGNKYAYQIGLKGIDLILPTFDVQIEYNQVQPYTYTHYNTSANFTHYNQFVAHPYGANLRDWTVLVRYQPISGLFMTFRYTYLLRGEDENGRNWGSDIFRSNTQIVRLFGNRVLQGQRKTYRIFQAWFSYQLRPHMVYIDVELWHRDARWGGYGGLRWNIFYKLAKF